MVDIKLFLDKLSLASTSTLALAAYAIVVAAWCFWVWRRFSLESRSEKILRDYKEESERTRALRSILGEEPPLGLAAKDLLEWTKTKSAERTKKMLLAAYLSTLCALVVIIGMTEFVAPPKGKGLVVLQDDIQRVEPPRNGK